jgi:hypothetical protein
MATQTNVQPTTAPASSAVPTVPTTSTTSDLNTYLSQASSLLGPSETNLETATTNAAKQEAAGENLMASQETAQLPLVQQTYANLSAELSTQENIDVGAEKATGEQNIGGAKASLAAAGVTDAAGSFEAPVTAAQNQQNENIASTAASYAAQQTTAVTNMETQIQQINDKAADYTEQGNIDVANALTSVAQMQSSYNTELLNYASSSEAAEQSYNLDLAKFNISALSSISSSQSTAVDNLFWQTGVNKGAANSNTDFNTTFQNISNEIALATGSTPSNATVDSLLGVPKTLVDANVPGTVWWANKGSSSFNYNGTTYYAGSVPKGAPKNSVGNAYSVIASSGSDATITYTDKDPGLATDQSGPNAGATPQPSSSKTNSDGGFLNTLEDAALAGGL